MTDLTTTSWTKLLAAWRERQHGATFPPAGVSDPVAAVAESIARAEREAPPLAEVPFSLTPVLGRSAGHQKELF